LFSSPALAMEAPRIKEVIAYLGREDPWALDLLSLWQ
jgi:hypothetical protein